MSMCHWRSKRDGRGPVKKIAYASKEEAQAHATELAERRQQEIDIYACWHCGYYHVGRQPKILLMDRQTEAQNERIAGQFVGKLRKILNPQP